MVELKDIKKNGNRRDVLMSVRTTKDISKWMKEHEISPTLLFNKAAEELMEEMQEEVVGDKE